MWPLRVCLWAAALALGVLAVHPAALAQDATPEQADGGGDEPVGKPLVVRAFGEARPDWREAGLMVDGVALRVDVSVLGGGVMKWDAMDEVGNGYGVQVGVTIEHWLRLALAGGGVLPDAMTQGHFGTLWLEGQWRPLGAWYGFEPYLLVGVGVALADEPPTDDGLDQPPARWSREANALLMAGVGLQYGAPRGLFVTVDFRVMNLTHGAWSLGAGWRF